MACDVRPVPSVHAARCPLGPLGSGTGSHTVGSGPCALLEEMSPQNPLAEPRRVPSALVKRLLRRRKDGGGGVWGSCWRSGRGQRGHHGGGLGPRAEGLGAHSCQRLKGRPLLWLSLSGHRSENRSREVAAGWGPGNWKHEGRGGCQPTRTSPRLWISTFMWQPRGCGGPPGAGVRATHGPGGSHGAPVHLAPARPPSHVSTRCPRPYFLATAPRLRVRCVCPSGRAGSRGLGRVPSSRLTPRGPRSTPPLEMRLSC